MKRKLFSLFLLLSLVVFLSSCAGMTNMMESMTKPKAQTDAGLAEQLPAYTGPKAKIAVGNFNWKVGTGGRTVTIRGAGAQPVTITEQESGVMGGLRDMLTTTLIQSGRYRVLERQELSAIQEEMTLKGNTNQQRGVTTADLLIVAAVTGWEPGTSGVGGGVGAGTLGVIGAIAGSFKKSSMAMDIRIIDTDTSEVLAATRVEGEAKDINFGTILGGLTGNVGLGGALGMYAKTPMEKAIRVCIGEAVKYIVSSTPNEYLKY